MDCSVQIIGIPETSHNMMCCLYRTHLFIDQMSKHWWRYEVKVWL